MELTLSEKRRLKERQTIIEKQARAAILKKWKSVKEVRFDRFPPIILGDEIHYRIRVLAFFDKKTTKGIDIVGNIKKGGK